MLLLRSVFTKISVYIPSYFSFSSVFSITNHWNSLMEIVWHFTISASSFGEMFHWLREVEGKLCCWCRWKCPSWCLYANFFISTWFASTISFFLGCFFFSKSWDIQNFAEYFIRSASFSGYNHPDLVKTVTDPRFVVRYLTFVVIITKIFHVWHLNNVCQCLKLLWKIIHWFGYQVLFTKLASLCTRNITKVSFRQQQ